MTVSLASAYELVIFDLDGVVYIGTEAVPGAPEWIQATVEAGTPVAYVTNNASRRAAEVASLLQTLGVPASVDQVLTAGRAAAEMLAADLPTGAAVLVVGADALREEIRAVGLTPVDTADGPVAVVQGYGPGVGWAELAEACVAIRAGARWVATNVDATLPSRRGPLPGNGSMVAALATALGRGPDVVVGKPSPALFEAAARHGNVRHGDVGHGDVGHGDVGHGNPGKGGDGGRVLVVGDRLDTDIEGARRAGMDSLLVLTGVSTRLDVLRAAPAERPTHVAADLGALSTPERALRVPEWADDQAAVGVWRVTHAGGALVLGEPADGTGESMDALRALASGAWAHDQSTGHDQWTGIVAGGPVAGRALEMLGLETVAVKAPHGSGLRGASGV